MRDSRADAFAWLLKVETAVRLMHAPTCQEPGACTSDEGLPQALHQEGALAALLERYDRDGYAHGYQVGQDGQRHT
jgi:hypothetical protein